MNMDYIRQRILMILDERKMTQKELASRSKIAYVPLNRFLSGGRGNIGLDTLLSIAKGLNIPVDFLLSQKKVASSMLLDTVIYKIDKLPEPAKKEFLLSISNILDLLIDNAAQNTDDTDDKADDEK